MAVIFRHRGSMIATYNVRVDAAARIQSSIAGPISLRNTLPPLASNELLAASLFWISAQEGLYPFGSTALVLMLHANRNVRYPTVKAEDAKIRVRG